MYEKKINIFNDVDRKIFNVTFKYNVFFFIMLLIMFFALLLWKKDYYIENIISFSDSQNALIMVDKKHINMVKNINTLYLNNGEFKYYIDKIEERSDDYILSIHFDKALSIKTPQYRVLLKKESIFEYIIRIIKGG